MPKVSVIIPVYNAEKYIKNTIDSIANQTFKDWELILVEDGSKDNTPKMVDDIAKSFNSKVGEKKILVIHQANSGPALARNNGIDKAKGEYLSFVDSDDSVEPLYLEKLVDAMEAYNADIVWCNFLECFGDTVLKRDHKLPLNTCIPQDHLLDFFYCAHPHIGSLWNKMYRRAFVEKNHTRINPQRYHGEDWEFNFQLFLNNPVVVPIGDFLYRYIRQNTHSVIASYHSCDFDNLIRTMVMLEDVSCKTNFVYDKKAMMSRTIYQIVTLLVKLSQSNVTNKIQECNRFASSQYVRDLLKSRQYNTDCLTMKQKLYFNIFRLRLHRMNMLLMKRFK